MIWIEQFLLRTIFQLFTTKSIQFTHIFRHSEDSLLFTQWTQKEHLKLYFLKGTDVPIYKCKNAKKYLTKSCGCCNNTVSSLKNKERRRAKNHIKHCREQVTGLLVCNRLQDFMHRSVHFEIFFFTLLPLLSLSRIAFKVILSLYLTVTRQFQI